MGQMGVERCERVAQDGGDTCIHKALGSVCKSSRLVGKGKMQYIEIFDIYRPVFDFYSL